MADFVHDDLHKKVNAILEDIDLENTSAKKIRQQIKQMLGCDLSSYNNEIEDIIMKFINSKDTKKSSEMAHIEENKEDKKKGSEKEKKSKEFEKPAAKKPKKAVSQKSIPNDRSASSSDKKNSSADPEAANKRILFSMNKKDSVSDFNKELTKNQEPKKGGTGNRGGGAIMRECKLSPELSALVGQERMTRPQVVKMIWAIIKERNLYDPANKQFAICDDDLMKVIGVKHFRIFGMMKYLKLHFLD